MLQIMHQAIRWEQSTQIHLFLLTEFPSDSVLPEGLGPGILLPLYQAAK